MLRKRIIFSLIYERGFFNQSRNFRLQKAGNLTWLKRNYNFKEIIQKYNLDDYIVTIIFKNNEEIRVLNKINFNEKIDIKNLSFKNINLNDDKEIKKFIENLKTIFENYWKSKNEINTSVKLPITISINNKNNSKISEFELILSNVDLIYEFNILKFNNKNNIYSTALCPGFTVTEFHTMSGTQDRMDKVPSFMKLSADQVAQEGIDGMYKNKEIVIPGNLNRFLISVLRFFPTSAIKWIGNKIAGGRYK